MPAVEISLDKLKPILADCFTVTDANIKSLYGVGVRDSCGKDIFPEECIEIPPGENAKSLSVVEKIAAQMLACGVGKGDTVAAVGGGAVGDAAGLAAALYMRGVRWINVPTTLLAFADSSAGGKTAVNLCGRKNILGAFHAPCEIYHCFEFLDTLPHAEYQSGMGEIIKTALLDPDVYRLVSQKAAAPELIRACTCFKDRVTAQDFYDCGLRRTLNMGHTVGHAIELLYGLRHGESVALGLRAEQAMMGLTDKALARWMYIQTEPILSSIVNRIDWDCQRITEAALSDKKNSAHRNPKDKNLRSGNSIGIEIIVPISVGSVQAVTLSPDEFCRRLSDVLCAIV